MRRRTSLLVATAIGVLLVAAVAIAVLRSTVLSPESAARTYVEMIAEGRLEEASAVVEPPTMGANGVLRQDGVLSGDQYLQLNRIEVSRMGNDQLRKAHVSYLVAGERHTGSVTLQREPGVLGLGGWRVITPLVRGVTFVSEEFETVTVNGIEVPVEVEGGAYIVYPGVYEVRVATGARTLEVDAGTPAIIVDLDTPTER